VVQTLREQWKAFDEDQSRTERAVGNVRHDPNVLLPPKRISYSYIWMLEATGGPPGGDLAISRLCGGSASWSSARWSAGSYP
jgi:hypothetical protein